MNEEEIIYEFHIRLCDISNISFVLREKMSEENLAKKILRSLLPKRFEMKVTALEEAHELSSIKVDELISYLQTFEMSIRPSGDKDKYIYVCRGGKGTSWPTH